MRGRATTEHCRSVALRCVIVDDNRGFLDAARAVLEGEDIEVVAVATTRTEAFARVCDLHPDVVLVDVHLGEESGLDVARRIGESRGLSSTAVILISSYAEVDLAELALHSHAAGWLSKSDLRSSVIRSFLDQPPGAGYS